MPWKTAVLVSLLVPAIAVAQAQPTIDDAEQPQTAGFHTKIYGYVDGYMEKSGAQPAGVDAGGIVREKQPIDFTVRNLNLMVQSSYGEHLRSFVNIKAVGDDRLEVRNAWVDGCIAGGALCLRLGKLYRPFGLYNEILDAVPSYIGVEPPELFDSDHLMVTRTTNFMLHGRLDLSGTTALNYAVTTGVDERRFDQFPIGLDLNFEAGTAFKVGTSFYTTNGQAAPSNGVGDGAPVGGVLPWMLYDKYYVAGAYAQYTANDLIVQAEFWTSPHRGERDPEQVLLLTEAGLNSRQAARFGLDGATPSAADVRTAANYTVKTFYTRVGYSIPVMSEGEIVPYVQYDYYKNPEEINSKSFGGDNEAGLADDGLFQKATAGVVFRPVPVAALKVDGSFHFQKFNGVNTSYPELHISLSYNWSLFSM